MTTVSDMRITLVWKKPSFPRVNPINIRYACYNKYYFEILAIVHTKTRLQLRDESSKKHRPVAMSEEKQGSTPGATCYSGLQQESSFA